MTVKELREFLETCPDDARISVRHGNPRTGFWQAPVPIHWLKATSDRVEDWEWFPPMSLESTNNISLIKVTR